jgi:glucosylceramidase
MAFSRLPLLLAAAIAGCSDGPPAVTRDASVALDPIPVALVVTSEGAPLTDVADLALGAPLPSDVPTFAVDRSVRHQRIDGFGASFLESGLVVLNSLPTREAQDEVLAQLFDRDTGAGFSIMKTVIGATDFQAASPEWFTYADTPGDTALASFTIARDLEENGVLTYIRRAREQGGVFQLQATMDYPPDWMLTPSQNVNPDYYPVLADYYLRYLQAYAAEDVHIDVLTLFNEPMVYTKIPTGDIHVLLRDHVGPLLTAESPETRIMVAEFDMRQRVPEFYPILEDPLAAPFAEMLGYHGYDQRRDLIAAGNFDDVAAARTRFPEMPIWLTEVCCVRWNEQSTSWSDGEVWGAIILHDLAAGANAWTYWNMILDQDGGPWLISEEHGNPVANAQMSVVVIDRETHEVTYAPLYYYLRHFSRYVRPNATRIGLTPQSGFAPAMTGDLFGLAFENEDGTIVVVVQSRADEPSTVQVDFDGRSLRTELPAHSIATFVW